MNSDKKLSKGQITGLLSPSLEKWRLNKIRNHIIGDIILDFGCGYGKLAAKIPEKHYFGVDIDEKVLLSARNINADLKNAQFYNVDSSEWRSYKFDTIILAAVIEHLDNPSQFLMDFKKLLKSNGRIIITTPAPMASTILMIGSRILLFSKDAIEEQKKA